MEKYYKFKVVEASGREFFEYVYARSEGEARQKLKIRLMVEWSMTGFKAHLCESVVLPGLR